MTVDLGYTLDPRDRKLWDEIYRWAPRDRVPTITKAENDLLVQHLFRYEALIGAVEPFVAIEEGVRPELINEDRADHPDLANSLNWDYDTAPEMLASWTGLDISKCHAILYEHLIMNAAAGLEMDADNPHLPMSEKDVKQWLLYYYEVWFPAVPTVEFH